MRDAVLPQAPDVLPELAQDPIRDLAAFHVVEPPGLGQVRGGAGAAHPLGYPLAQAALLRVARRALRAAAAEQQGAQLTFEMHVLDEGRFKIAF